MNPSLAFVGPSSLNHSTNGTNFNNSNHQSTSSTSSSPRLARKAPVLKAHNASTISDHIYRAYLRSEYTDVTLSCQSMDGTVYDLNLHAVIISQSPVFRELLAYQYQPPKPLIITLPSFISYQAFTIAITSLYSPQSASTHITLNNAFAILCASYFLHLDSLSLEAMEVLSRGIDNKSITDEEIVSLVDWCNYLVGSEGGQGAFEIAPNGIDLFGKGIKNLMLNGNMNGGQQQQQQQQQPVENDQRSMYLGYATRLKYELSERLIRLPFELGITVSDCGGKPSAGFSAFLQICTKLPFDWFKNIIESRSFPIQEDMDRFSLAKKIVSERKKLRSGTGAGEFEETVVLQFGTGLPGGTAVNIIRKRNQKKLWKVNGNE